MGMSALQDSLSLEGQLWARLWETALLLCSWGMSPTVAPSGTWRRGKQRLGSFFVSSRGVGLSPSLHLPRKPCSAVEC